MTPPLPLRCACAERATRARKHCLLFVALICAPLHAGAQALPTDTAAAPAAVTAPAFRDLFTRTVTDFQRLPTAQSLAWLTMGGVAASLGHTFDARTTQALSASPAWNDMLQAGKTLGGARMQFAAAFGTFAAGKVTRNARVAAVGADLVRAQLMTQALTASVKLSVRRGRPDGTHYSFPSGHAAGAFATATVLQRDLGWKAGLPAYALASYVAASRIQDQRHFLSDVTFGAAVGMIAGRAVTFSAGSRRVAMSPLAAPGGGGVSFTVLDR
jgi:membrane-associated phospholipid phosphatase